MSNNWSVIGAVDYTFVQNIIKEGFQYKQLLFFFHFVTWISWIFGHFSWYSRIFCTKTWKPWVVFMKCEKSKNIETHLVPIWSLGPQFRPSLGTKWVSIFFYFCILWNHQRCHVFSQKYSWNYQILKKNEWNQVTQRKSGFSLKPMKCIVPRMEKREHNPYGIHWQ